MAGASILLAVVVLGAAVQVLLGRQLRDSLDRTLRTRAADVALLNASAPALLTSPGVFDSSVAPRGLYVEVLDRHGRIVARSLALGGSALPAARLASGVIRSGVAGYATARLGQDAVRVYAAPLADLGSGPAGGGAVVVASSTSQIDETLRHLRQLTVLAGLGAAALAAPIALLMTRRVLRPLERLTQDASEIQRTADTSRRLPAGGSADEVGRLSAALNGMLEALEQAREAERRFLADASHELRTPLTALRGNAAYVARHGADRRALADLEADVARLARLVDDLLALAREDAAAAPAEGLEVDALVERIGREDRRLVVSATAGCSVRGDRDAIERAVQNLLENARRYGPSGRPISLAAERIGQEAVISVTDSGSGLPGVTIEQAGTRFWRGPNSAGTPGSGLGLALVRATAERHGGGLTMDGARFAIHLPVLRDLSNDAATRQEAAQQKDPS